MQATGSAGSEVVGVKIPSVFLALSELKRAHMLFALKSFPWTIMVIKIREV